MRQVVTSPSLTPPTGPFSTAIVADGPFLFLAGQIGTHPDTGQYGDGIREQTELALANMQRVLDAGGSSLSDVVRVLVFMANADDNAAFNDVYRTFFSVDPPVRTRVQAARLAPGSLVEIEAIAVVRNRQEE